MSTLESEVAALVVDPDSFKEPLSPWSTAARGGGTGQSRGATATTPANHAPPPAAAQEWQGLQYLSGFGNSFTSEALPGALPVGQNNPRVCPYGLYAEQLSGTAFTAPRKENQRTWLYRIKPSVTHEPFQPCAESARSPGGGLVSDFTDGATAATPNQLRWQPPVVPTAQTDFLQGLSTMCGAGSPSMKSGFAIHMYVANAPMRERAFANADGDFLIVPQQGRLWVSTEMGRLQVAPGEAAVMQQGIRFAVDLPDGASRGYICEVFGGHFQLPELGPIGANGLANPRDFLHPVAHFDDRRPGGAGFVVVHKFDGDLFQARQDFSPFNVVAWHGNYVPFKYDLTKFCPMNAVAFDHPDPSIFTVLTCPTARPGVAAVDFVLFPPRWSVAEHTFRPPYFHRNCMNEFMGLVRGVYEAKAHGFVPGGASLHSCMSPHGPDTETFERAVSEEESSAPQRLPPTTLAFMFESSFTPRVTRSALESPRLDKDYYKCWEGLRPHFSREKGPPPPV